MEAAEVVVFPRRHQEVEALKNEDVIVVNEDSNEVFESSTTTTTTLKSSDVIDVVGDIADEERLYSGEIAEQKKTCEIK